MPCGPSGKFFQPGKKKAEPKKKAVKVEESKESTAKVVKVVKVDVPEIIDGSPVVQVIGDNPGIKITENLREKIKDIAKEEKDPELLPKETGQKRRRRAK